MFECKICKAKFSLINQYNEHQFIHKFDMEPRFFCLYNNCRHQFSKYNSFKLHIYRKHYSTSKKLLKCNVSQCNFITETCFKFNSHLYDHIRKGKYIFCPYSNCNVATSFSSDANFRAHVFRKHSSQRSNLYKILKRVKVKEVNQVIELTKMIEILLMIIWKLWIIM